MAKRRKKAKRSVRRRSRRSSMFGALGGIDLMGSLMVIGGAVGGKFLNKVIPDTIDKKLVSGGKIVLGVILPMLAKGNTKNALTNVGHGLVAVGSIELLSEMGVLAGLGITDDTELAVAIEGIEDISFEDVTGEVNADVLSEGDDIPVINADVMGQDDIPVINGEQYDY